MWFCDQNQNFSEALKTRATVMFGIRHFKCLSRITSVKIYEVNVKSFKFQVFKKSLTMFMIYCSELKKNIKNLMNSSLVPNLILVCLGQ